MKKMVFALALLGVNAGLLGKTVQQTQKATLHIKNPKPYTLTLGDTKVGKLSSTSVSIPVGTDYVIKVGKYSKKRLTVNLKPGKSEYKLTIKKENKEPVYNSSTMSVK